MKTLKEVIINKEHFCYRKRIDELATGFSSQQLSDSERVVRRFEIMCDNETPVILPQQQIVLMRTVKNLPDCFTKEEWEDIRKTHYVHESGYVSNLLPDYETIIRTGFNEYYKDADQYVLREIKALLDLCDRYLAEAKKIGRQDVVDMLEWIPRKPARTLREAFQFFRVLHYSYQIEGGYQIVGGRIDQMFNPYLEDDIKAGILNEKSALELVKDFFLSFNIDADMYDGVQQGDNGQSIVLGGVDENGVEQFNLLSKLCLLASKENLVIDPKVNIRVNKNTPIEIFELCSELTKAGLGFPQYLNDDVIIEGLLKKGYEFKDAINYAVAACWEIIIPKYGFEVVNIGACSFAKVMEKTVKERTEYNDFNDVLNEYCSQIKKECEHIISQFHDLYFVPAMLIESALDVKYRNFGIHGTGLACAADSLQAIKEIVFKEKLMTLKEFKEIVDQNFIGHEELLNKVRYHLPKMGQNHAETDDIACKILECFANYLDTQGNEWGGQYRAGTGSAMFYLDHAYEIGASFDGRRKNEPLSANYSPSIFAKINGPISICESFTKPNLVHAMNGGPLTLEFEASMFKDADSIHKIARYVKLFIIKGGHQLQLNAVNLDDLKQAQLEPEKHQQLVVRIWGWSAYFVELDKEFQDHVMARQEYRL